MASHTVPPGGNQAVKHMDVYAAVYIHRIAVCKWI